MTLLGQALRQAVGLAARALGVSAEALREEAGVVLVGHSSRKATLDRDWGQPKAREQALRVVLAEVERRHTWLEQHQRLVEEGAPLQDVMDPIARIVTPDTAPDPDGGPGGARIKACTSLPAPGRKAGHALRRTTSPATSDPDT